VTDVSLLCGTSLKDRLRDAETISDRARHEGLGFFTKALPKLGKAIDRSFETGNLETPSGFRRQRGSKIPVFLRGIFRCCYDENGTLLAYQSHPTLQAFEAIRGLRQICFLFYKLETDYHPKLVSRFLENFKSTDDGLPSEGDLPKSLTLLASQFIEEALAGIDLKSIVPGHGPGAVATRESGFEKYTFKRKYASLHSLFPYYSYFMVGNGKELADRLGWYKGLQGLDPIARVVLVPKDSRGPRLISCEPLEIQWVQQGVRRNLYDHVEKHRLTRGYVNFDDQTVNQNLALSGSINGLWATIDLKDASDRVSMSLVRSLFPDEVLEVLEATRSVKTELPSGEIVTLKKFAPMGSALCFPVEALVFWAIAQAAIHAFPRGRYYTLANVYVYGDDIVVPVQHVDVVCEALESCGLKVNREKSYSKGFFRESCGVDAWHGCDITPVRVKHFNVGSRNSYRDADLCANMSAVINGLFRRGYWRASSYMVELWEELFGRLPYGTSQSGYPCMEVDNPHLAEELNLRRLKARWSPDLQRYEFKILTVTGKYRSAHFDGWERLLRSLIGDPGEFPERYSLRKQTKIKKVWAPV